jgi:hypothetical protein
MGGDDRLWRRRDCALRFADILFYSPSQLLGLPWIELSGHGRLSDRSHINIPFVASFAFEAGFANFQPLIAQMPN